MSTDAISIVTFGNCWAEQSDKLVRGISCGIKDLAWSTHSPLGQDFPRECDRWEN